MSARSIARHAIPRSGFGISLSHRENDRPFKWRLRVGVDHAAAIGPVGHAIEVAVVVIVGRHRGCAQ